MRHEDSIAKSLPAVRQGTRRNPVLLSVFESLRQTFFGSRKGRVLQIHHKSTLFTCAEIVQMKFFTVFFPEIDLP